MKHNLKFTGDFTKLKEMGYEFRKLYANNYKVYHYKIDRSFDLWVWVGNGGYIEIDDLYSNTKNVVESIRSIDWNHKDVIYSKSSDERRVYIRFNHSHPDRGSQIAYKSFELEAMMSLPDDIKNRSIDDIYMEHYMRRQDEIKETYDREICVWEHCATELLSQIDKINLVDSK